MTRDIRDVRADLDEYEKLTVVVHALSTAVDAYLADLLSVETRAAITDELRRVEARQQELRGRIMGL